MRIDKPKKKRKKSLRINKLVRESVIDRDDGKCRVTGQPAAEIHHIVYRSRGGNNSAYNLISLSRQQHELVHKNGKKWFKILYQMQKEVYPELTKELMKRK